MDNQSDAGDEDVGTMPIVRDSTFVRFVADKVVITDVGRDVEVGFLQFGPIHSSMKDEPEFEIYSSSPQLTEVARMRISYSSLVGFAMGFLRGGIIDGKLKPDAIESSFSEWILEAADAKGESTDE